MARKRFTAEQIISKLREAEVLLAQGEKMGVVCKRIAVTEQTYYRWRKEYGGLRLDQAKRFKALEKENVRLKKLVAVHPLPSLMKSTPNLESSPHRYSQAREPILRTRPTLSG